MYVFYAIVAGLLASCVSNTLDFGNQDDEYPKCDGACVSIVNCPPARESVMKHGHHDFDRCGFDRFVEYVCCPDKQKQTESRNPKIRKSVKECERLVESRHIKLDFQILGGTDAAEGEFPHMCALGFEQDDSDDLQWNCGGTLISDRFVITAAHCVTKGETYKPKRIRFGRLNVHEESDRKTEDDYEVRNITVHPDYSRISKINDIALVELESSVKFSKNIYPACLYTESDDPKGLVITGWGITVFGGGSSPILMKAFVDPVPLTSCNDSYTSLPFGKSITRSQICAMSSVGKIDTCQGDSGGPLQVQNLVNSSVYRIVGVTSYGRGCGGSAPGIYTRIYSYLSWIEDIVWP